MRYRPEIDGLRAVAVIPVIFFHAGFSLFSGGFIGVDVFFVISGYLITTIILADLERGRFSIIDFYERRARRILPALFLVMAVSLPFAWFWMVPQDIKGFSDSLVAVSTFVSNILFWRTSDYFDTAAELKPMLHTWSLAVEEQYYVIFPIFLLLAWRFGRRWILAIMLVVASISLAMAQWLHATNISAAFYLLPTRGWELLIGAFVAFYLSRQVLAEPGRLVREFACAIGFAMLLYAIFVFDKQTPFPSFYTLVPTLGAAFLILFANADTLIGRVLTSKAFVGIGLISYSAYLWHQPLFAFARHHRLEQPSPVIYGGLVLSTLALAYLSWKYVEAPCRNRQRISRNQIFTFAVVGSALFISLGLLGHLSNGFEQQKTTDEIRAVLTTAKSSPKRQECHTDGANYRKPADACEYHTGALKWATFGDSHTVELAYALADELQPRGIKLKHFSFSGCPPTFGRFLAGANRYCSEWTQEAATFIAENPSIETVVVSYRINASLFGEHETVYPMLPKSVGNQQREESWKSYVQVIRYFVESGKRVIVVLQAPELPRPMNFMTLRATAPMVSIAGVTAEWWVKRNSFVRSRLGELPPEVTVIDPALIFCDGTNCLAGGDGTAYYFDDDHLSVEGARLVATRIVAAVGQ